MRSSTIKTFVALTFALRVTHSLSAPLELTPLSTIPYTVGGGLSATWSQVRDDYRFSQQMWSEAGSAPAAIGTFDWGTGIWGTTDIAHVQGLANNASALIGRVTDTSAVNFGNLTYNMLYADGALGSWGYDRIRPLAPIVEMTGSQTNYAASFVGYLYIPEPGSYDFSLFVDDGFVFSLSGANGVLSMARDTLAGSTAGRDLFTLSAANGGSTMLLGSGYYAMEIDYFNRLEAGVIDLALWGPQDQGWRSISSEWLFAELPASVIPEPSSLALTLLAFAAFRHRQHQGRPRALSSFA